MSDGRYALLVTASAYQDARLRQLRSPVSDAEALGGVLSDPQVGDFHVSRLHDTPEHIIRKSLDRFFANRQSNDTLLLYFSCHGLKDDDGRLYFATSDTDMDSLRATAISARFVNELVEDCRSRRVMLILDCCYSGAFAKGMLGKADKAVHVGESFEGHGRAVLTASSSMEYAYEGDSLEGAGQTSVFTSALVEALSDPMADRDRDGWINIEELYQYVFDRVRVATHQTPKKWLFDVDGQHLRVSRTSHKRPALVPDRTWHRTSVFYRLLLDTFYDSDGDGAGDIEGLTEKLDYLQGLGIGCVWVGPIQQLGPLGEPVGQEDLFALRHGAGDFKQVERMIDEAHRRSLRVICDVTAYADKKGDFKNSDELARAVVEFWLNLGFDGVCVGNSGGLAGSVLILPVDGDSCRDSGAGDGSLRGTDWPSDGTASWQASMTFEPVVLPLLLAIFRQQRYPLERLDPICCAGVSGDGVGLVLRDEGAIVLDGISDDERDYLLAQTRDPRAFHEKGIRRRLAPLVGNSRAALEFLYALFFSLPGSPVLYYGEEIGMGDALARPGLEGLSTPMQWNGEKNAGFSSAVPSKLHRRVIESAVFGFSAVNVEDQTRNGSSLLEWFRRTLRARRALHEVFGLGSIDGVYAENPSVLAFVRSWRGRNVLCVYNVSSFFQAAYLQLTDFSGAVPVELTGRIRFPVIGPDSYVVTLPGYGVYWFELIERS